MIKFDVTRSSAIPGRPIALEFMPNDENSIVHLLTMGEAGMIAVALIEMLIRELKEGRK